MALRSHVASGTTFAAAFVNAEGHPLLGLDRLVLRLHVAYRAAEPDHLPRHGVAEQREICRLAVARCLDQARTRAEVDAQQLTQLTAGPGRQKPGHLVLDVGRERNANYLPRVGARIRALFSSPPSPKCSLLSL